MIDLNLFGGDDEVPDVPSTPIKRGVDPPAPKPKDD
jgi:hypothetical protein